MSETASLTRLADRSAAMLAGWGQDDATEDVLTLPSPDFWKIEAPAARGLQYLAFDLVGATFALPLGSIREVDRLPPVASLPNTPPWLLGVSSLRGELLSVVDLSAFLGLAEPRIPRDARLMACRAGGLEAGLVVERIRDIRELPDASISPPAGALPGRAARFLAGVHTGDGRLTLVLDCQRLLHSPEFRRFE